MERETELHVKLIFFSIADTSEKVHSTGELYKFRYRNPSLSLLQMNHL